MKSYKTMTDEQLIMELRSGDVVIIDFIMNKYKNLIRQKAKAMYLLGGEKDDLIQEGMIGLFKAIRDFDLDNGTAFFSFAELCVSRQIYKAIEASTRQKHIPLNSYISLYEEGERKDEHTTLPLIDMLQTSKVSNPEELFLSKEYLEQFERRLREQLSPLERKVLYLHLLGTDYKTIASLLEKGEKTIDNALQRVKRKVNKVIHQFQKD